MRPDKVMSMLGLAMKAGKISSGEFMTESAIKSGKAYLALVACDASNNTKKNFRNMCEYYKVPYYECGDKDTLGHCIGKEFRASLAVLDQGFAASIVKQISNQVNN